MIPRIFQLNPSLIESRKLLRVSPGESKITLVQDDPFIRGTNNSDRDFSLVSYRNLPRKFLWLTESPEKALNYLRDENLVDVRLPALFNDPFGVAAVPFPFLWVGATVTNESQFLLHSSIASLLPSPVKVLYLKRLKRFPATFENYLYAQREAGQGIDWVLYEGRRYGSSKVARDTYTACERQGIPFHALRMSSLTHWDTPSYTPHKFNSWDADTWPERLPQQFPPAAFE